MRSALYQGVVTHVRKRPRRHRLRYKVVQVLLDLEELPDLDRSLRLFGFNRAAPFSFHEKDHGDGSGDLRGWVQERLASAGLEPATRIQVLCMARMFGYVFNPLSVYFCRGTRDQPTAVIYEVHNTFGERHAYVLKADAADAGPLQQACDKTFYVSPFLPMDLRYEFRVLPPGERTSIEVTVHGDQGTMLATCFSGRVRRLTDRSLLWMVFACPAMTLKVTAAIHWEALKLWLRGLRIVPRRPRLAH